MSYLEPRKGESYLDLTAGYGGHASAILDRVDKNGSATLVDRDESAVEVINELFGKDPRVSIQRSDFLSAASELSEQGQKFDMILLDLGVSSPQLDTAQRGFSFRHDGPLDMRMDQSQELSAREIVNRYPQEKLAKLIKDYGEDYRASQIARAIAEARPITTTGQLAEAIESKIRRQGKIHPATRTFQAIRIAVNDELGQLESVLPLLVDLLSPGGRLAIISFHSLEDRLVKNWLKENAEGYTASLQILTKKPISGSQDVYNPRARSAKLRAAVKIKTDSPKQRAKTERG